MQSATGISKQNETQQETDHTPPKPQTSQKASVYAVRTAIILYHCNLKEETSKRKKVIHYFLMSVNSKFSSIILSVVKI